MTTNPASIAEHYGEVIVHAVTDGEYNKTGLPNRSSSRTTSLSAMTALCG